MDATLVLANMGTPNKTAADTVGAQLKACVKAGKTQSSITKHDFKKLLENCVMTGVWAALPQNGMDSGDNQSDNSMCSDSLPISDGIVGTLEGFELLGYQADKDDAVQTEELLHILQNAVGDTDAIQKDMPAETFAKRLYTNAEQETELSGQFAGMRSNEPLNAPQSMTQQEILQRVGAYLCSLESTNNQPTDKTQTLDGQTGTQTMPEGQRSTAAAPNSLDAADSKPAPIPVEAKQEPHKDGAAKEPEHESGAESKSITGSAIVPGGGVTAAKGQTKTDAVQDTANAPDAMKENVMRIVDKVQTCSAQGRHDFDIQLKPEFLGKLHVKLVMEDGCIKVQIKAQDQAVKGLVSDQLPVLQSMFEEKGIAVSQIDVFGGNQMFGHHDQPASEQNSGNNGRRRQQKNDLSAEIGAQNAVYDVMELPHIALETCSVEFHA